MVRCDITGEPVPEDETVVIEGKRVSARGKQILLDRLSTGHNLDGELEAPGSWRRLGCYILDAILVGVAGALVGFVVGFTLMTGSVEDVRVGAAAELLGALIGMLYFGLMHAAGGQTLGKKAGRYKVVNLDGTDIEMKTAMLRAFMFVGINGISAVVLLIGGIQIVVVYQIIAVVVGVYALANAITVLVSKDKRAIHDMIAGTRVVMLDA